MTIRTTLAGLPELVGRALGETEPILVDQRRINLFADATDDHQWIHVDPARAAVGPFGTTVAHGYLTLALVIPVWEQLLDVEDAGVKVNYGVDRVRFPEPTPVNARLRGTATIVELDPLPGGVQLHVDIALATEFGTKPACVARAQFRYLR
ncbi:MAG: MaoC family dehydratase [Nocardioides sp.]